MPRARRDRGDPKVRLGEHSLGRRRIRGRQASPRSRRVERVGQTSERGASLAQGADGVDQLARRTCEAIELPGERVALMDRFHRFEQGGSIDCSAGDMLSEDLFRIRLRSATSVARVLIGSENAGIANRPGALGLAAIAINSHGSDPVRADGPARAGWNSSFGAAQDPFIIPRHHPTPRRCRRMCRRLLHS